MISKQKPTNQQGSMRILDRLPPLELHLGHLRGEPRRYLRYRDAEAQHYHEHHVLVTIYYMLFVCNSWLWLISMWSLNMLVIRKWYCVISNRLTKCNNVYIVTTLSINGLSKSIILFQSESVFLILSRSTRPFGKCDAIY